MPPRTPPRRQAAAVLIIGLGLGPAGAAAGAEPAPLPDPLPLSYVLAAAGEPHPSLALSEADVLGSEARQARARVQDGLQVDLTLDARYVEPGAGAPDDSRNDTRASLIARKQLTDFGRTGNTVSAATASLRGSEFRLQDRQQQRRIQLMEAYFEVLLADLRLAQENEFMASAYVEMDRARDRNELGQASDIEVLEKEDAYQTARLRRYRAETLQLSTRTRLAQLLNRPQDPPANLVTPQLPGNDSPLPPYEALIPVALTQNPVLQSLRAQLEAAGKQLEAERLANRPRLLAEVEATHYEREFGSRDPFRASLILDIPLYSGGRVDADIATAQAERYRLQAELEQGELDVRQAVLVTWQEVRTLGAQREQARVRGDYRDLYLDRSRALYELDVKADLGDAMAEQSAARLFRAQTDYALALAWARLAALSGAVDFDPLKPPADNPLAAYAGGPGPQAGTP